MKKSSAINHALELLERIIAEALLLLLNNGGAKDNFKNIIDQMMLLVVKHNSANCMQVLLDYGFDINGYYLNNENIRMTPLMMALNKREQYTESKIKFIVYLLDNGANIVYRKELYYQQCFIAIRENNAEMLSLLLRLGTKSKSKDNFKNIIDQIMMLVVKHDSVNCMQVLLDYRFDINGYYLNNENIRMTPLMMALSNWKQYLVESKIKFIVYLLDNGANIVYEKEHCYQPFFETILANNEEMLSLLLKLLSTKDNFKNIIDQIMLLIVKCNSVKCMQVLLNYGCNINGYYLNDENIRMTPLMMALNKMEQYTESKIKFIVYLLDNSANIVYIKELDYQQCFRAIGEDNAEMLSLLLRLNTKDKFKNIFGQMMFQVVKRNAIKCMQVLLDNGCDINEYYINYENIIMTPLMMALDTVNNDFITYLLKKGADTNVRYEDSKGTTLIEKAIQNIYLDIAFQLRKYGAQADETIVKKITTKYGFDPNVVKSLKSLSTTVVKESYKNKLDDLPIPPPLKNYLKKNVIFN